MAIRLPQRVLVDSGFWFALFNVRDPHHRDALAREGLLQSATIVLPWPSLYETMNTRFVKDQRGMRGFEHIVKRTNTIRVDDLPYREDAFAQTLDTATFRRRPIGLVDMVIRFMLDDSNLRVGYLLTYNVPDFMDICRKRTIQIL